MNRTGVLVAVLLLAATVAVFGVDFAIGPKVVATHNFAYGEDFSDDNDGRKLKPGVSAGAFAEIGVLPMLAVQPELYFTMGGSKYDSKTSGDERESDVKFIELAVLLKGMFEAGPVGVQVFAGPDIRYGIGEWDFDGTKLDKDERDDNDIRNTYFGVVAGAGATFGGLGPGELQVDVRTTLSLQNIDAEDDEVSKLGAFGLGVGYAIPLM